MVLSRFDHLKLQTVDPILLDSNFTHLMNSYKTSGYDDPISLVFDDQFCFLKALKTGCMVSNELLEHLTELEQERLAKYSSNKLKGF